MGFSEKPQVSDVGLELEGKRWVVAGIPVRAPLRPIHTNPVEKESETEECSTTPTGEESKISTRLPCPPAPRKRKATLKCNYSGAREYFTPPELETFFIVSQRAN